MTAPGALDGLLVLDLTTFLSGPYQPVDKMPPPHGRHSM